MTYGKRGNIVRVIYLIVSLGYNFLQRLGMVTKSGLLTLCYHGVTKEQHEKFLAQMGYLSGLIIRTEKMEEHIVETLSICLTFDDSFENLLNNVVPIITELRIPIVVFAPTGCLGERPGWLDDSHADYNENVMTRDQISTLNTNNFVILGSHTVSHLHLTALSKTNIRKELEDSKNALEEITGDSIDQLAFPHGDYNDIVLKIAFDLGYEKVYTLNPVIHNRQDKVVGRFSMSPDVWPVEFRLTVHGAYSWLFAWRLLLKRIRQVVRFRAAS